MRDRAEERDREALSAKAERLGALRVVDVSPVGVSCLTGEVFVGVILEDDKGLRVRANPRGKLPVVGDFWRVKAPFFGSVLELSERV